MNKMNLPPPFGPGAPTPLLRKSKRKQLVESESESESESDEERRHKRALTTPSTTYTPTPSAATPGTPSSPTLSSILPALQPPPIAVSTAGGSASKAKPMQIVFHSTGTVPEAPEPQDMEVITSIISEPVGKFQMPVASSVPSIPKEELDAKRMKMEELLQLPIYKKYNRGNPTCRLYIKNLPKTVNLQNLYMLFGRYFETEDQIKRDLKVKILEGRLKGQAYVTFPSQSMAERALDDVHAYVYQEKPLIIVCVDMCGDCIDDQFAEEEKKTPGPAASTPSSS